MDRSDQVIKAYGLIPDKEFLDKIRELLTDEIANSDSEDNEYLKTLCIQLFAIGYEEDTLLIWRAKRKNFDSGCYIDVQLLCVSGIEDTLNYLNELGTEEADEELSYLKKCISSHDFDNFSKEDILNEYKDYYGIY